MSNLLFGTPNYLDDSSLYEPSLTGGDWEDDLPLENLKDRRLSRVARSSDDSAASTKFTVDLGVARPIGLIGCPETNLSVNATVRIYGGSTSEATDYDSGAIEVFPSSTGIDAETLANDRLRGINFGFVHVPASVQSYRYWRTEISDSSNPDGYVELARLFIAGAWQPSVNPEYGFKLGVETSSTRTESDGGAAIYNERPRRRWAAGVLGQLPEDEAFEDAFEIQRRLGTTKQLYFVLDPENEKHTHRWNFVGVFRDLSPIDFPYFARNASAFHIVEEL